jgi:hypothetical protein
MKEDVEKFASGAVGEEFDMGAAAATCKLAMTKRKRAIFTELMFHTKEGDQAFWLCESERG